jgi:hypothetical protein
MLEPVAIVLPICVITHDLGRLQRAEHVTDPLNAPTHHPGDLAWRELAILSEQLNDRERDRISKQSAQPRLSVAFFLDEAYVPRFRNSGNVEV